MMAPLLNAKDVQCVIHIPDEGTTGNIHSENKQHKPRPLSLFDNFEIFGGVPTTVLRTPAGTRSLDGYTFSDDGSRMAIHYDKISIRHVANSICLVEFWNSKSDTLIVILENREICFIHISATDETAHAAGAEDVTNEDGLAITPRFIPHPDRRATLNFFSVSQSGGVMWIAERNFCYNGTLLVTCVSERDIKQLEIKSDLPIRPKFLLLSIPARTLMAIYKNEGQEAFETRICQDLDFSASAINTKTIKIKGRVVSWSTDGRHVLIWQVDTSTQHRLVHCVYGDFKGLTTNTPAASLSQKTLGFGIMHLKVEFLNRTKSPFGTPYSFVDKPLVAVIIARSAGLGLLVWDISSDEIKKEMILSSDQGSDESVTDIEYSLSSNMKWIATCNRRSGAVRVFSIVTSALIWSYELEMKLPNYILSSSLYFDPLDSRLVIANREASFAFSLPCLLEKDQINLEVIMYDFQAKVEFPPKCLMPNPDLLSHNTLFNILSHYIPSTSRMTLLDFSILPYTSKATAVVRIMEEVSVVFGRVDVVFATLVNGFTRQAPENETRSQRPDKVTINQQSKKYAFCNNFTYVFLYQQENDQQYIALFSLRDGIRAVFVDIFEGYSQEFIDFDNEVDTWFGISQTRNGIQVTCLGIYGVKIVDLGQRSVVCNVPYECHMIKWLKTFYSCFKCYDRKYIEGVLNQPVLDHLYFKFAELFRSYGLCDISDNGKRILLGWDVDKRREFILSQCSKDDEMSQLQSRAKYLVPCWTLNDNLQHRAYLEIDENKGNLSSLLFCGHGDVVVERLDQTKLNPSQKRSLNEISLTSGCTANLHFDASNGCLWFIALQQSHERLKLWMIPFTPHALKGCIPTLHMVGMRQENLESIDLKRYIAKYGVSFINMPFGDTCNMQLSCEKEYHDLQTKLFCYANENKLSLNIIWKIDKDNKGPRDILERTIIQANHTSVAATLDVVAKQVIPLDQAASLMKNHFKSLWICYKPLFLPFLKNNFLCWKVGEIDVPTNTYTTKSLLRCRLHTTFSLLEWGMNGNSNTLSDHWSFLNDKFLRHNKNKGSRAIIASNIVFLCIENACGIGLKGIMRFLLFQNVPSSTFQMDLVKFVVLWKWETIWKDRSLNHASIYVCFLVVYSTYAICIAYLYESLKHSVLIKILLTILLGLSIGFTLPFIKQEYRESKAYFRDGKIFEPVDQYWGVRYYLKSVWNVFEIIAYILMVLVLPVFHGFAIFASTYTLPFLCILAFELVLVWTKVWYFAQAFDQTGAFVLLIASVVKDCTVFLTLAVVFLLGFGLFMFVVFQYSLSVLECTENSNEECDDEIRNKIFSSFGNPLKAMLTLFYAMIGTFDPEVSSL